MKLRNKIELFLRLNKVVYLFIMLIISQLSFAQKYQREPINLDEFIQNIFPIQQENLNYEDFYEAFYQLYQEPLDLNSAEREELASLYILSEMQINSLLDYRQNFGKFLSIYELQAIPNFDLQIIRKILPFVVVNVDVKLGHPTDNYLILRSNRTIEQQKGYQNGNYLGANLYTYARYRLANPKDFSLGFTLEKDAGEPNYADFFSGHLLFKNKGSWKNIVIGDYQVQIGQGLIASAGFFVGKGSETINTVRRSNLGIRPYSSIIESGFFRGGAATYQINKVVITGFFSKNRRDATLNQSDTLSREGFASALLSTGYHRTQSEISRKNSIGELDLGVDITAKIRGGEMGITALNTLFDVALQKKDVPYNRFEFSGKQNTVFGSHFTYNWQNVNFFAEMAHSSGGGIGGVGGLLAALSKQVEFSMVFRHYDKDFHSFYASAFGENTRNINEQGTYWGIKYLPNKRLTFSAYYDQFKFPWVKYLVSSPSIGNDYFFKISYQPNKKVLLYAQFHEEHKAKNLPSGTAQTDVLAMTLRRTMLFDVDYSVNRTFKTQTRLQFTDFGYINTSPSKGYAIMQDVEGNLKKCKLKGRIAYFKTDDYNARIYAFENDVLYAVSMPAYYGTGIRSYLVVQRALNKHIDFWLRIARTQLLSASIYGSGNDQINAAHKTDIKLQVRYQFW